VFWFGYIVVYVFIISSACSADLGSGGKAGARLALFPRAIFVLGIASGTLSEMIRHLREELSRVLAEDYIRTRAPRACGMAHAFKEGFLIPVTEIMSAKIPFCSAVR